MGALNVRDETGQVSVELALMVLVGLGLATFLGMGMSMGFSTLVTKLTALL